MADNTTGLHVKSLPTETVRAKLVDTGGTNEAAISAAGRVSVDGSGVTQPVSGTVAVSSITTSITPGTAAANLGKAEDAVAADGDVGVAVLAVRRDSASSGVTADGDYANLSVDSSGALRVTGGSGGTQYVGDAAATATPTGTISMGLANAAAPTDVSANNDAVSMWMLRNGSPVVNIASGGTLFTAGQTTMSASFPVTLASNQSALSVTLTAGTNTNEVVGDVAQDAPIAGNPLSAGGRASSATPTAMSADGDSVYMWLDRSGGVIVNGRDAHDAALDANTNPALIGGRASAAAPSDVSADGDAARMWVLRNGSPVVNLASGGTLWTNMGQTNATGQFVRLTDGTTNVSVIAGTTALKTDLSSVAGTATVTGGISGVQAIAGPTASDAVLSAQPLTFGGRASTAVPTAVSADGDVVDARFLRTGALTVHMVDASGNAASVGGGTQYVGDAAATSTPTGTIAMGLANAAAPTDVSANNDAVSMWMLRNGSPVNNIALGGTLVAGATSPFPTRLSDGSAYYTNTGQTAGTAPFTRITDATNTAAVIATINSLKVDASSIAGAVPSATNPLPVRLTDGTAFYSAVAGAPVSPKFSTQTSAALGAGASVDLDHTLITNGTTGQLAGVDVSSTVPLKIEIKTVNSGGTATTRDVFFAPTYSNFQWRAPYKTYITQAGAATNARFRVTVTNKDNATAADVYSTAFWDEV